MFKAQNTRDETTSHMKSMFFAPHGWGKTTQFKYLQEYYGDGFIISGESGLSSIRSAGIDYLPFNSWDNGSDPEKNKYSFVDIFRWMKTDDFKSKDYKWIGLDSLTELSSHSLKAAQEKCDAEAKEQGKKNANGFEAWAKHSANLIGACKAIRDMPVHFLVTALAKESQDENGNIEHWPYLDGKAIQQALPGIFDNVFAGVRATSGDKNDAKVLRYIITDDVKGWKGKVRDEKRRLAPVEQTGNLVDLLKKMSMPDADFKKLKPKETEA
tara:strand:+ start:1811 stop:2617 length:807 start_codon:yes stop_codon:yes gene_type:complete